MIYIHTSILSYDNYDMCTSLRNMRPAVKPAFHGAVLILT